MDFLAYLEGEKTFGSAHEVIKFCGRFNEDFDEKYVLAVLIIDFSFTASIEDLKTLASTKQFKDPELGHVSKVLHSHVAFGYNFLISQRHSIIMMI